MTNYNAFFLLLATLTVTIGIVETAAEELDQNEALAKHLTISWANNYLTIWGDFPGNQLRIHYLEAYCRPGSTDRDWGETVIPHKTLMVCSSSKRRGIHLIDTLADGVIVQHAITAGKDFVDFRLVACNQARAKKSTAKSTWSKLISIRCLNAITKIFLHRRLVRSEARVY